MSTTKRPGSDCWIAAFHDSTYGFLKLGFTTKRSESLSTEAAAALLALVMTPFDGTTGRMSEGNPLSKVAGVTPSASTAGPKLATAGLKALLARTGKL